MRNRRLRFQPHGLRPVGDGNDERFLAQVFDTEMENGLVYYFREQGANDLVFFDPDEVRFAIGTGVRRVLRAAVSEETSAVLRTRSTVSQVLTQFESCLRRWRWDSSDLKTPVRWPIRSEREVQDILWLMLRGVLHDLEDEDTLPKFGHSTYRADLGIPSLGLLIEVKFARTATDFKTIEKQVLEDVEPYRRSPERYREILVFIYDDSCSVQEHETTRRALRSVPGIADVLIVSRPSHLPTAADRRE